MEPLEGCLVLSAKKQLINEKTNNLGGAGRDQKDGEISVLFQKDGPQLQLRTEDGSLYLHFEVCAGQKVGAVDFGQSGEIVACCEPLGRKEREEKKGKAIWGSRGKEHS